MIALNFFAILLTVRRLVDKIFPIQWMGNLKIKIEQGLLPRFQAVGLAHMEVVQKLGMVVTANTIIFFQKRVSRYTANFAFLD